MTYVGPRKILGADLGGGGWERSGFANYTRRIGETVYEFRMYWEPDSRAPENPPA